MLLPGIHASLKDMLRSLKEEGVTGATVEVRLSGRDYQKAQAEFTALGIDAETMPMNGEMFGNQFKIWRDVA